MSEALGYHELPVAVKTPWFCVSCSINWSRGILVGNYVEIMIFLDLLKREIMGSSNAENLYALPFLLRNTYAFIKTEQERQENK